jgi:DNA-binding MarR family transcriptional regulator
VRFEATKIEPVYQVLDALAWLKLPEAGQIAQYAGIDPRTAGKLLKNCVTIGLVEVVNDRQFRLLQPYPHKGSLEQKRAVIREALVRMPLLVDVRQFLQLGDSLDDALRKGAAVQHVENYYPTALGPLLDWAQEFDALTPGLDAEDLVEEATTAKEERHRDEADKRVVFLSHSSKDKPFIRKLATDLTEQGVTVWLDEQNIHVGDSIPERIAQGLAESDYFLIALSAASVDSEWVKHELNNALVNEIARRKVTILPVRLDDAPIPSVLRDKKYADFGKSYKEGFAELMSAINARRGSVT